MAQINPGNWSSENNSNSSGNQYNNITLETQVLEVLIMSTRYATLAERKESFSEIV